MNDETRMTKGNIPCFVIGLRHFDPYRTWLETPSGGRPLRNSACCRSASFRCCASRDACSGSGPGLEQPNKTRVNTGIKKMNGASFFIEQSLTIINPTNAANSRKGNQNDEIPMTKGCFAVRVCSGFVILISFVIRHSCFALLAVSPKHVVNSRARGLLNVR